MTGYYIFAGIGTRASLWWFLYSTFPVLTLQVPERPFQLHRAFCYCTAGREGLGRDVSGCDAKEHQWPKKKEKANVGPLSQLASSLDWSAAYRKQPHPIGCLVAFIAWDGDECFKYMVFINAYVLINGFLAMKMNMFSHISRAFELGIYDSKEFPIKIIFYH